MLSSLHRWNISEFDAWYIYQYIYLLLLGIYESDAKFDRSSEGSLTSSQKSAHEKLQVMGK